MASSDRVLWWGSGSTPCWRVQIALEEKGLAYDSRLIEFGKGEHKSPEILALNPRGQVPTFKDGDVVVNESIAALLYLQDAYPQPSLLPSALSERAQVYQRLAEALVLQEKGNAAVYMKMRGQVKTPEDEKVFMEKVQVTLAELGRWEGYLGTAEYAAGTAFSLADVVLTPIVLALQRFGATYKAHPYLKAYAARCAARPSVQSTWPPHWKTTSNQTWLSESI